MKSCKVDVEKYVEQLEAAGLIEAPKSVLFAINGLFAMQRRLTRLGKLDKEEQDTFAQSSAATLRGIDRILRGFEEEFFVFCEDPDGEAFIETRSDLDAAIAGEGLHNLYVVEVEKPIIRRGSRASSAVIQKGVVIVESRGE